MTLHEFTMGVIGAGAGTEGEAEQAWEEAILDMAQEIGERRWLGESR